MNQSVAAAAYTEAALVELKDALTQSGSPEDFLAQVDSLSGRPENILPLPYDTGAPLPLGRAPGEGGIDSDNGPAVFDFLGAMDPSNASDPRLWNYMTFNVYRDYMEARWPLVGDNWRQRANTRWLLLGSTRGRLVRHGIARLWWVTNLTYDARLEHVLSRQSQDPFAYTRAVFRNEDRINALFDREAGAIESVTRAVLEHASKNSVFARDNHVRAIMKELTLIMGFRDLGLLAADALEEVIDEVRPRYEDEDDLGRLITVAL